MKMTELNYAEQIEINGGRRLSRRETTGGGGRSLGDECKRDWGKVAKGVGEIGLGLSYKAMNKENDNDLLSGLADYGADFHIERGSKRLKEGWYGGCGHSKYKRTHKK